jgi:hypothetical protein
VLYNGANRVTVSNVPAGVSKLSVANANGVIGAQIVRNGAVIRQYDSGGQFAWST